jgi:hypothetical protein
MRTKDYIIIVLLICTWGAGYFHLLFPEHTQVQPFLYSDKVIYLHWYIFLLGTCMQLCVFPVALFLSAKRELHWITKDIVIITIIFFIFELIWFMLFYNNPFHMPAAVIKSLVVGIIFISIKSIRHRARIRNSIFRRGNI